MAPVRFASNIKPRSTSIRNEDGITPCTTICQNYCQIRNEEQSTPTSLRVGDINLYHNEKVPTKEGHVVSSNHYLNHLDSSRFQKHIFNLNWKIRNRVRGRTTRTSRLHLSNLRYGYQFNPRLLIPGFRRNLNPNNGTSSRKMDQQKLSTNKSHF